MRLNILPWLTGQHFPVGGRSDQSINPPYPRISPSSKRNARIPSRRKAPCNKEVTNQITHDDEATRPFFGWWITRWTSKSPRLTKRISAPLPHLAASILYARLHCCRSALLLQRTIGRILENQLPVRGCLLPASVHITEGSAPLTTAHDPRRGRCRRKDPSLNLREINGTLRYQGFPM